MVGLGEELNELKVVKRDGRKVDFNGTKIALAIQKGFESVKIIDDDNAYVFKYTEKDTNKVFVGVMKKIVKDYKGKEKIKIEEIQDLIEEQLKKDKLAISIKEEDLMDLDIEKLNNKLKKEINYDKLNSYKNNVVKVAEIILNT